MRLRLMKSPGGLPDGFFFFFVMAGMESQRLTSLIFPVESHCQARTLRIHEGLVLFVNLAKINVVPSECSIDRPLLTQRSYSFSPGSDFLLYYLPPAILWSLTIDSLNVDIFTWRTSSQEGKLSETCWWINSFIRLCSRSKSTFLISLLYFGLSWQSTLDFL